MQQLRTTLIASAVLFALTVLDAQSSSAATYWAAPNGSDSNSCSSVSGTSDPKRYRTIGGIWSCLSAGDTAKLKAGTYNYYAKNPPIPSGTSTTNRTKIVCETITNPPSCSLRPTNAPAGAEIFVFNGVIKRHIEFDGLLFDARGMTSHNGAFRTSGGSISDVWLKNCEATFEGGSFPGSAIILGSEFTDGGVINCDIHHWNPGGGTNPGSHAIYLRGKRNLIERNRFHDLESLGIQLYYSKGAGVDDNIVRYNTIYNTGKSGILCGTGARNKCYGNLIYSTGSYGIAVRGTDTEIYNNTIYKTQKNGIEITTSSAKVRNNIVFMASSNINNVAGATAVSNNLTSDPLFVDPARANFRLKAGSPAIDRGASIGMVSIDLDGNSRPQGGAYDTGAYEYITGTSSSGPPAVPGSLQAISR